MYYEEMVRDFWSRRRRRTRWLQVTGDETCALPIEMGDRSDTHTHTTHTHTHTTHTHAHTIHTHTHTIHTHTHTIHTHTHTVCLLFSLSCFVGASGVCGVCVCGVCGACVCVWGGGVCVCVVWVCVCVSGKGHELVCDGYGYV